MGYENRKQDQHFCLTGLDFSCDVQNQLAPLLINLSIVGMITKIAAMADERLQNIFLHLSPPIIVNAMESTQPSRWSALCSSSFNPGLGSVEESSGSTGNLRAVENSSLFRERFYQCDKLFNIECRGPNSNREAKLLKNLLLSSLRRHFILGNYKETSLNGFKLGIAPCSSEQISRDGVEVYEEAKLKTEGLEIVNDDPQAKPTPCDGATIKAEPRNMETSGEDGILENGDRKCGIPVGESTERVCSGITSASAASTSERNPLVNLRVDKQSKYMGHILPLRVPSCEFCDIVDGTSPCFKLYEDDLCLCVLDLNPLCQGHSLIIPKAHFPCLEATPPQVAAAMCAAVPLISSALLAATRCDSFNMLVNSGAAAGQVIMHTHFHIIPRCKGDGLWKSESVYRKPMQKVHDAKLLAHAVRSKLLSTAGSVSE